MRPESGFHIAPNWPQIGKLTMMSQFGDMTSSPNFFEVAVFLLSSWVTGPNFMSISLLVLELWQFFFISDSRNLEIGSTPIWEIWKSEVPPLWVLSNIWKHGWVRDTKVFNSAFQSKISEWNGSDDPMKMTRWYYQISI